MTFLFHQRVRQKSMNLITASTPTKVRVTVVSLMVPMQTATKKEW